MTTFLDRTAQNAGADGPSDAPPAAPPQRGLFGRLGAWSAHRRWYVLAAWTLVLVGTTLGSTALNGSFEAAFKLPGSTAQIGADLIEAHTDDGLKKGAVEPVTGTAVFHVDAQSLAAHSAEIESATAAIADLPGVRSVDDPFEEISPDGRVAIATITYEAAVTELAASNASAVDGAVADLRDSGVTVDYAGDLGEAAGPAESAIAEMIGVLVAVLILLLAFGSVLATLIPVMSAIIGVFAGVGVLGMTAAIVAFPDESTTLALMMGLGVGIDYALFLSTRFRQLILDGVAPVEAVARTVATSGRAVVIAASTVIVSLLGLFASGVVYIGQLGIAAAITVAVAALASITLVPALLAIAGNRIDVLKIRKRPVAEPAPHSTRGWHAYARALGRHPVVYLVSALALLVTLALPLLSLQVGNPGVQAQSTETTERRASDAIDSGFGDGYQSALAIVLAVPAGQTDDQVQAVAAHITDSIAAADGVAAMPGFARSDDGDLLVGEVVPTTRESDPATGELIRSLQNTVIPASVPEAYVGYVTGSAAVSIALESAVSASLPAIILTVVAAAVLLMLLTFRSPLLALKAGVTNLLSIGASFGVLVAVFQWGWGSSLFGIAQPIPIVSFVPILMFAIVFGLSMDYEVFLLARIREAVFGGMSNRQGVAHGLAMTARIITCAAVIMACVFFSFLLQPSVTIKMLALGLGVSVLIDVIIVRLVVVPCAMLLSGRANWWTPRWLDRALPHLEP